MRSKKRVCTMLMVGCMALFGFSQVGIDTDAPDPSAMLHLNATDKGFLPPRLSSQQRDGISNAAVGLTIFNTEKGCLEVFVGLGWRSMCGQVAATDVLNPQTGQIWMDRNLGATAVSSTPVSNYTNAADYILAESNSFGDLYQWGRATEGHQLRSSGIFDGDLVTARPLDGTTSGTWTGLFISDPVDNNDNRNWFQGIDNALWQGADGVNNPCPQGYRVPTDAELDAERLSWPSNNSAGAFASPLKWPAAGFRGFVGTVTNVFQAGRVWSSTVAGDSARNLRFANAAGVIEASRRVFGYSIRCIKE